MRNPGIVRVRGSALVPNFGELILGRLEADVHKQFKIRAHVAGCFKDLHELRNFAPLQTKTFSKSIIHFEKSVTMCYHKLSK